MAKQATRVEVEGGPEAVTAYLRQRRMTDGLPVVPPTEERVAAMIDASGFDAGHVVGEMAPLNAPASVEKIAINAVMAGCEPSYMPALIAAVDAFMDPKMNAHGIQTTTNPVGPMIMFNGPIRDEIGINYDTGCFGPGAQANATIGRALRLVLINVGGATHGDVDKAPLGWPGKFTSACFGEHEEESPWQPFHVDRGFEPTDSTVTIIPINGMWPITEMSPENDQVLHHVTFGMAVSGHAATEQLPEGFENVLIMSPVIAKMVAEVMPDKEDLRRYIFENARVPMHFHPPYRREAARQRMDEMGFKWDGENVPITLNERRILIICAGGLGGLQSIGASCMLGMSVTRKIPR